MTVQTDYFPELLTELQTLTSDLSIEKLMKAIQSYPADPRLFLMLGAEQAQSGNTDAAEASFICALNRAPAFSIARFQLGLLQFSNQRVATAFATWEMLGALAENDPLRLFTAAIENYATGEYAKALPLFEAGIANNTANAPLNIDMERFIKKIRQHLDTPLAETAAEVTSDVSAHFFMSAYKNH